MPSQIIRNDLRTNKNINVYVIVGMITSIETLRYTPAGFPVLAFSVQHQSQQIENGVWREVMLNIDVLAIGDIAKPITTMIEKLSVDKNNNNPYILVEGFLANKSLKRHKPILHACRIEWHEV